MIPAHLYVIVMPRPRYADATITEQGVTVRPLVQPNDEQGSEERKDNPGGAIMTRERANFHRATVPSTWIRVASIVLLLSFLSLVSVPTGLATTTEGSTSEGTPAGAGLQAASWLLTIPYGAFKVGIALAGGLVGGMTYAVTGGNLQAAQSVWQATMYGTYVLTPGHLIGREPVRFIGVPEDQAKA
jgi:hypothetical protein